MAEQARADARAVHDTARTSSAICLHKVAEYGAAMPRFRDGVQQPQNANMPRARDGDVHIPWSIAGRKEMFRSCAEKLAEGIPGAFAYETPKLWNVAKGGNKLLSVLELLDSSAAVRTALEILNVAMKPAAETC
jgi:hypothetical protein